MALDLASLLAKPTGWPPPRYERRPDDPILEGTGPAECSSCTALSVLPAVIWDVNGYYRDLGVSPHASRKDLRLAYQEADGQSSVRLTYVIKQLLNPAVRFEYDCTPLGEVFMDDYVRDLINRKIKDEMSKRMARLHDMGVDTDLVDAESLERDVAHEMGWDMEDDTPVDVVDETTSIGQDDARPAKFSYAYYLWAMQRSTDAATDHDRLVTLAEWQRQLVSALSREGVQMTFAVGLHGKPNRWVQGQIAYRTVFFLSRWEEPSAELATEVAKRYAAATPLAITTQR